MHQHVNDTSTSQKDLVVRCLQEELVGEYLSKIDHCSRNTSDNDCDDNNQIQKVQKSTYSASREYQGDGE